MGGTPAVTTKIAAFKSVNFGPKINSFDNFLFHIQIYYSQRISLQNIVTVNCTQYANKFFTFPPLRGIWDLHQKQRPPFYYLAYVYPLNRLFFYSTRLRFISISCHPIAMKSRKRSISNVQKYITHVNHVFNFINIIMGMQSCELIEHKT